MFRSGPILVIGGASVDRVRADNEPRTTPGGAALFTALAARRAGGDARLFGFRPDPLPDLFSEISALVPWAGPACRIEDIPHFEIVYEADGNARLAAANWGIEETLDPSMVGDDLLDVALIHIAAIKAPELQMRFVRELRKRTSAKISAGTYGYMARRAPDTVRALMEAVDLFFMNEFEEELVFGDAQPTVRPGQVLVVTRGARGSDVWQGDHCTRVPICESTPVDLTGAGDSVCGGTLAGLMRGLHPTAAVQLGSAVASMTIEACGMEALMRVAPADIDDRRTSAVADSRVQVNRVQIEAIGAFIRDLDEIKSTDFVSEHLPEVGDPRALNYFFAMVLHQFGFWSPANGVYAGPTYATIDGLRLKGSDYCFAAFKRLLENEPQCLTPFGQSSLRWADTEAIFATDQATVPLPVLATHHALARGYGRDMWELGLTPASVVEAANASADPVSHLVSVLDHITGYREDPLRKKSMLLALMLGQRPEKFIDLKRSKSVAPVVDYHVMRSCLRTGLVEAGEESLREQLVGRRLLKPSDEMAVRAACYSAIEELRIASGRDLGAIDYFFYQARKRCPEMEEPDCANCPIDPVCKHDKALFQPVYRTTAY
jgi:sugar/nucleoside kinase (ribokinase family)